MKTMELEAGKTEIIRSVLNIDSSETLEAVKRAINRTLKRCTPPNAQPLDEAVGENWPQLGPQTLEEMNRRISQAEADIEAGRCISSKQVYQDIRQKIAEL